ncbi:MAG: hypothetical protein U0452_05770 [Anaerolineae bacterium]
MTTGRRSFKFAGIALIALLCVALPMVALAQAETPQPPAVTEEPVAAPTPAPSSVVTVTGTVTNGTSGGTVPSDLVVNLRDVESNMEETVIPAVLSSDGTFTVADVPIYSDHVYVATAEYQGSIFSSAVLSGSDLAAAPSLAITIYEITDDPSVISISSLQAQAAVTLNQLQILELYTFSNSSDRAYRAPDGASVRVNVPSGAQIYDMGSARFLISEDGSQMIDNALVMPGEGHTLHVLFSLPYGGETTVSHTVNYPLLNGFEVVISDPGLSVSGDGVSPLGGRDTGMAFGVQASVPAGGSVTYTISGTPAPAATPNPSGTTGTASTISSGGINIPPLSLVLMILGGACVGVALVLFIRERRRPAPAPTSGGVDPRVNELVQQIAELDVAFQAGQLSKEDYESQRAALKSELMSLARDGSEE